MADDAIIRWEPALNGFLMFSRRTRTLQILDSLELHAMTDRVIRGEPPGPRALTSPMKVFVAITRACELSCPFCFSFSNTQKKPMLFSLIESIVRQAAGMGVFEIRLTGGEPTTHPDFFNIVSLIDELGMNISLNTHGVFSSLLLRQLMESPVDDIRISIDGLEPVHDALRGPGSYQRAILSVRELGSSGKSVRLNTLICRDNCQILEEIVLLSQELGVKVRFSPMRPIGRARDREYSASHVLSNAEWHAIEGDLIARGLTKKDVFCFSIEDHEDLSLCPGAAAGMDESQCSSLVTQIGIDPEGEVYAGGRIDDIDKSLSLGSAFDTALPVLWGRALRDVDLRVFSRFPRCISCSRSSKWQFWRRDLSEGPTGSRHLY